MKIKADYLQDLEISAVLLLRMGRPAALISKNFNPEHLVAEDESLKLEAVRFDQSPDVMAIRAFFNTLNPKRKEIKCSLEQVIKVINNLNDVSPVTARVSWNKEQFAAARTFIEMLQDTENQNGIPERAIEDFHKGIVNAEKLEAYL